MIRDRGVAVRYVHALFGAASQRNELEAVAGDLESLRRLEETDPTFQNLLESPSILDDRKRDLIDSVLSGKVERLTIEFLHLMLRKKRIQHFPLVFQPFRELVEDRLGILRAEVTSATALEEDLLRRVGETVEWRTGKRTRVEAKVDQRLIGGAVITIGGKILDTSIRNKLDALREELLATRVH